MSDISSLVPRHVAEKIGFASLDKAIQQFKDVSLLELIETNTNLTFLGDAEKICYRMEYRTLTFTALEALDNFTNPIVSKYKDSYIRQQMHSISGEQNDLCFYTYSPRQLIQFLEQNKRNKYTFLPMTVHATESANGYRHDMLLIFNNQSKLFYWFDGRNREDYLPFGRDIPKNAIDILLINLADHVKLGYTYEPAPSWTIQGILQPFASIGQYDFLFSTGWCYLVILMMDSYDSPIAWLSALDTMSREDRFYLLYKALRHMISAYYYRNTVPQNAQVNFYEEKDVMANSDVRPQPVEPTRKAPQSLQVADNTSNAQGCVCFDDSLQQMTIVSSIEHDQSQSNTPRSKKGRCVVM